MRHACCTSTLGLALGRGDGPFESWLDGGAGWCATVWGPSLTAFPNPQGCLRFVGRFASRARGLFFVIFVFIWPEARGGGEASGEEMAKEGRPTVLVAAEVSQAHPMGRWCRATGGVQWQWGMCAMCHVHV